MYIFKLKLSEKARGYCMYVFLVFFIQVPFKLFSIVLYYKICNLMHTMQSDVTLCIICISNNF